MGGKQEALVKMRCEKWPGETSVMCDIEMRLKVHSPASLAVYRLTVPDNSLQIHYVHVVYTDSRGENENE